MRQYEYKKLLTSKLDAVFCIHIATPFEQLRLIISYVSIIKNRNHT